MDDEMRSAAAPRWRGKPGRLEVWYATLSDPLTHAGLWIHCETVAPGGGPEAPYAHGWVTWFAPDGAPRTERFGPEPTPPRRTRRRPPPAGWEIGRASCRERV